MQHWKLTLAYDGTPFHGWQVQPGLSTIQGTLADALHRIAGERVLPQGSGRTDAGVHALGQVASFSLAAAIPPANLHRALNRSLPPSIRVLTAEIAPPDFHARHSALRKTYEFRIFPLSPESAPRTSHPDRICPPTLAPYVWACPWPLDLAALNRAARHVVGVHDFTTFAASDPDLAHRNITECSAQTEPVRDFQKGRSQKVPFHDACHSERSEESPHFALTPAAEPSTAIRTIHQSHWEARDGLLIYLVTASGFLHHMVRNLVGTFVQAGAHRLDPDSIPTLLAARNRAAAGPTAPPSGLFLIHVDYPGNEQRTTEHAQRSTDNGQPA